MVFFFFFLEESVRTSVSSVLCFVLYLHFSSLVIRACYVFIKLKAQQESNKLSNNEKCLIPQEPYMPIFLKPSHEVRILNVNIVLFVWACICVIWFTSGFESFQKNPRSKTLWAWMSPGSDSVATSRAPGPRTLPGKCRARITSNICYSCIAKSCTLWGTDGKWQKTLSWLGVWRYHDRYEYCSSMANLDWHFNRQAMIAFWTMSFRQSLNHLGFQFPLVGTSEKMSCISKYVFIEKSDKVN